MGFTHHVRRHRYGSAVRTPIWMPTLIAGRTCMPRAFTTLAFSPSVRAAQARYGSRERMQQLAAREPDRAELSDEMQQRLRSANSVILGTASLDGWPHVQHRGGPP